MQINLVQKLTTIKKSKKMSVLKLSAKTGISQSTLANIFSRGMIPSVENLDKICTALDISLAEFFRADGEAFKSTYDPMFEKYVALPAEYKKNIANLVALIYDELEKNQNN